MRKMVIRELQRHFPARAPEWVNFVTISLWGLYGLLHPAVFQGRAYVAFRALFPNHTAVACSLIALTVGLVQGRALYVNGAYHRTPLWRLATSLASAAVWLMIFYGTWLSGIDAMILVMYFSAVLGNLISAYRASCDAVIADATWRAAGANKRGDTSGYPASGGA